MLGKAISHGNLINTLTFLPVITSDIYCLICCNKRSVTFQLPGLYLTGGTAAPLPSRTMPGDQIGWSGGGRDNSFTKSCPHLTQEKLPHLSRNPASTGLGGEGSFLLMEPLLTLSQPHREQRPTFSQNTTGQPEEIIGVKSLGLLKCLFLGLLQASSRLGKFILDSRALQSNKN